MYYDSPKKILIAEPNQKLYLPYAFLPSSYSITTATSIKDGIKHLRTKNTFDAIMVSTTFSIVEVIEILDVAKSISTTYLIPIIMVVDLSERLTSIVGTTWGNKLGILHSLSSPLEVFATLQRLFDTQVNPPPYFKLRERPHSQ